MTLTETRPRTRAAKRIRTALGLGACAVLFALPAPAIAGSGGVGDEPEAPETTTGARAKLVDGVAVAPASAPAKVKRAITAANRIIDKPYCYGGGHARWESRCYDCSGTVSYALGDRGAGVVDSPMPSGGFMRWEKGGKGEWITTYANGGHMYAVIAGLRLDTSQTPGNGPGWSKTKLHQRGYKVRHPRGL